MSCKNGVRSNEHEKYHTFSTRNHTRVRQNVVSSCINNETINSNKFVNNNISIIKNFHCFCHFHMFKIMFLKNYIWSVTAIVHLI